MNLTNVKLKNHNLCGFASFKPPHGMHVKFGYSAYGYGPNGLENDYRKQWSKWALKKKSEGTKVTIGNEV